VISIAHTWLTRVIASPRNSRAEADRFGGCQGECHPRISSVERHYRNRLAVASRLEHELIGWIAELRPPQKMPLERLNHRHHRIDEGANRSRSSPAAKRHSASWHLAYSSPETAQAGRSGIREVAWGIWTVS
jgi:hypothetical protein